LFAVLEILMRLTSFSDYALRLLMYADAAKGEVFTIEQAAQRYRISKPHLMKVASLLTGTGYLIAVRGRGGGLKLGRNASEIRLGDVVKATEPDFDIVECYRPDGDCPVTSYCRLPRILDSALLAFIESLNRSTLADIALGRLPGDAPAPAKGAPGVLS
jgi:Rrf2 family transcriptional regulator, nitric oxide-sensitive transcriptional repressor